MRRALVVDYGNAVAVYLFNVTVAVGNNNHTRVLCGTIFHTRTYDRRFRSDERHSLTLHVRTHESTGCVIVFEERYHGCCNGNYLSRRNVHVIYFISVYLLYFIVNTRHNELILEESVFIQRLVSFGDSAGLFLFGCHVNNLVGNLLVDLIDYLVRCLNEAVFVYSRVCCERTDKTDVRAFRSLDRTHTAVVRVVYVADIRACTLSAESAGAQCTQTALVSKLCKRILLIHEL